MGVWCVAWSVSAIRGNVTVQGFSNLLVLSCLFLLRMDQKILFFLIFFELSWVLKCHVYEFISLFG